MGETSLGLRSTGEGGRMGEFFRCSGIGADGPMVVNARGRPLVSPKDSARRNSRGTTGALDCSRARDADAVRALLLAGCGASYGSWEE